MSIDISYYSFSPSRADKGWEHFLEDYEKVKSGASKEPEWVYDIVLAVQENRDADLLQSFQRLDLEYGAVRCEPLDSGGVEYPMVEIIAKMKGFNFDNACLTKENWIAVYEQLNNGFIKKFARAVAKEMDWDDDEARDAVMELLQGARPVIKDLKETADSVYIHEGLEQVSVLAIDEMLKERAQKHYDQFKDVLK